MRDRYARLEFAACLVLVFAAGAMWQKLVGSEKRSVAVAAVAAAYEEPAPPHVVTRKPGRPSKPRSRKLKPTPVRLAADFNRLSALLIGTHGMIQNSPDVFSEIVAATYDRIPVVAVIAERAEELLVIEALEQHDIPTNAVQFMYVDLDTEWIRDYGPIFVRRSDGSPLILDPDYSDADGEQDRRLDDRFPSLLAGILGIEVEQFPLVMEGGNMLSNGEGVCATTVKIIVQNERRGHTLESIGKVLSERCGLTGWSYLAVPQDEVNGHIDMFMAFLAPNIAVVGEIDPEVDPISAGKLDEAVDLLQRHETSKGSMSVNRIPIAIPEKGVFRSFTNVVFANGVLLVPVYSDVDADTTDKAVAVYERLLPDWRIVRVQSDTIAAKQGVLHCVTLGIPHYVKPDKLFGWHPGLMEDA